MKRGGIESRGTESRGTESRGMESGRVESGGVEYEENEFEKLQLSDREAIWESPKDLEPEQEIEFHHIWKSLNFDHRNLTTRNGQAVHILNPGLHNHHQGPDFQQAKIHLDGMAFSGDAELHLNGKDWFRHGHAHDPGYNGVVLHVVMERGGAAPQREDGSTIPEICLAGRLKTKLASQTELSAGIGRSLPCASWLSTHKRLKHGAWLSALGNQRLQRKASLLGKQLHALKGDWQQLIWEGLARSLAGPVNAVPFEALTKALPYRLLQRYAVRSDRFRLEALLFGAAGTLTGGPELDDYHARLRAEWSFLARKHGLRAQPVALRFHRMRPPSFPTVRLSQLAGIALAFPGLASLLSPEGAAAFAGAEVTTSEYWESHARFGQPCRPGKRGLGRGFRERLLANTLVPLSMLYQEAHGLSASHSPQRDCLAVLPPEDNKIIRNYRALHLGPANALESQGLIELKKEFCDARRCLECRLGRRILKREGRAGIHI
ncbi:MAG TPA: DUF2851 family protein [Bacteroidetes bacterium]|nr:DUF2851 family protein [Bacteroidota bacterium]